MYVCVPIWAYIDVSSISSYFQSVSSKLAVPYLAHDGVNCTSRKTNITQCGYTKPIGYGPYCTHYYDAIVDCKSTSGVSLFDGNFMNSPVSGLKRFCRERDGTKKLWYHVICTFFN